MLKSTLVITLTAMLISAGSVLADEREFTEQEQQLLLRAEGLIGQVADLYEKGQSEKALHLAKEARAIHEKILGMEDLDYADSVEYLALLYHQLGDYTRAEPLHLEAKAIREKQLGNEHPDYATSLNNLADLYESMGEYSRAERLLLEVKSIREKALGNEHPDYADCLNSLAILLYSTGEYTRAEPLFLEAKANIEKVHGKAHRGYATILGNLAVVYKSLGEYARAEPLYAEVIAIEKKLLGKEHPDYAVSLNNLALLLYAMGDYARAERLLIEAKVIFEKVPGKEHPYYANFLDNLASVHQSLGEYSQAESLFLEAKEIREKVFGKEHPAYANSLNNLAIFYDKSGEYVRAEALLVESKSIFEKVHGKQHPAYASTMNNLALVYLSQGKYLRAEPLLLEAKAIRETVLGMEHPDYAVSLNAHASLYRSLTQFERAEPILRQAVDITMRNLEKSATVQSEQEQMRMGRSLRYLLDHHLACCLEGDLDSSDAISRLVVWKGSILTRARRLRQSAKDPAIAEQFRKLRSIASQFSVAVQSIPTPTQIPAWRKRLETLAEQQRTLELELARKSAAFRRAVQRGDFDAIRNAIPEDGVLVDYLECGSERPSLLASVIRREDTPLLFDLGTVEDIGAAVDTWREDFGMSIEGRTAGNKLRQAIWEPLLEHIGDAELILVSTDGVLGRLPLAALPGEKPDTYLIEDHRIACIPVPQLLPELVAEQNADHIDLQRILLVGDVDYDSGEIEIHATSKPPLAALASTRASYGLEWSKLEETGREVDFIKGLFEQDERFGERKVVELRGTNATESAVREYAPKFHVLHFATHGFFAPADKKNALAPTSSDKSQDRFQMLDQAHPQRFVGFSPGQLSGLVFAGANRPLTAPGPLGEEAENDDGIMTADEIAYLPLDGVELAVLSACETGLGEVAGGEGLIGIQRAFQIAGVDSVVATMWKVDDAMTRELMQRFYRNLSERNMSKLDALREAQLSLLKAQNLDSATLRGLGTKTVKVDVSETPPSRPNQWLSPRYWAPFVLSGDWR